MGTWQLPTAENGDLLCWSSSSPRLLPAEGRGKSLSAFPAACQRCLWYCQRRDRGGRCSKTPPKILHNTPPSPTDELQPVKNLLLFLPTMYFYQHIQINPFMPPCFIFYTQKGRGQIFSGTTTSVLQCMMFKSQWNYVYAIKSFYEEKLWIKL